MTDTVIKIEELSKRYRIGVKESRQDTFGMAAFHLIAAPIRNLGHLRRLSSFGQNDDSVNDVIWALRDVTLDIHEGEIVGIIGRNGAGKSTLLKVLSRITSPTKGRAIISGRVSSLLEVGTGFHPELTGRENVYLNGTVLGMSRREVDRKFDAIVDFSGVREFMDTPVKRYSSGMHLRLAFAVAAHLEPEILLIDEVLAVGDAEFQKKSLGRMEQIAREGRTVLFVSHNLSAINRLCPRTVLLDKGQVIKDGPSAEVTSAYMSVGGGADIRHWKLDDAPGSDDVKITTVALRGRDGSPISVVDVGDPVSIEVEYHVARPGIHFRSVALAYTQGSCAFVTMEPMETVKHERGFYRSSVRIPAHLLNEGEYIINIALITNQAGTKHYAEVFDALVLQVTDPITGSSARGDYTYQYIGAMRPWLDWLSEYIGPTEKS